MKIKICCLAFLVIICLIPNAGLCLTPIPLGNGEFSLTGTVLDMREGVAIVRVDDQTWPIPSTFPRNKGESVTLIFEIKDDNIVNLRIAEDHKEQKQPDN